MSRLPCLAALCFVLSACATPAASEPLAPEAPALAAPAYAPVFRPQDWRGTIAGETTKVAVLASTHLSGSSGRISSAQLEPLLARLEAFEPEIITYEGLGGEQCEQLRVSPERYNGAFETYCWGLDEAAAATGLSLPQALLEVESQLADWPDAPTPAQRRGLAAAFVASGDRPSAIVQWLQLPAQERREGDGVDAWMLGVLNREKAKLNENVDIAAVLAARLGLQRVYPVDDHTSDSIQASAGVGFGNAISQMWQSIPMDEIPGFVEYNARETAIETGEDVLALYRLLNRPDMQMTFVENDFGRALTMPPPDLFGRQYVAWYEARNLRMVANIRAAMGNRPGGRVLNIVGASHKAYYEAYLDQMSDVELVDIDTILGDAP